MAGTGTASRLIARGRWNPWTRGLSSHFRTHSNFLAAQLTYVYDRYLFHYISEDGVVYMCMADDSFGKGLPVVPLLPPPSHSTRRFRMPIRSCASA
ncbi:MAG: hypothetical protein BJ554DRAFT_3043 [Olpidium bornovanus]|uniref:Longin domain-containing protein n=1 Tax=Olpidium bornovanus TaxID=278681 RepID=A0A8H7ZPG3_9FUNG|nr:MAG: hypothetical protein BJ554DRAFT_3043 [Olpidium bornovanus]